MSTEHNKALVRRYYEEMWNRWDFALADELIGEGIVFRGSLGLGVRGREDFKEYMRAVRRAFPDFHNGVEELVAEGDQVVARLTYTGTHRGDLFGIAATGRRVTYAGVAIFRIVEGRIAEGWVLGDLRELARQLSDGAAKEAVTDFAVPILTGRWVQLEALAEAHREGLRAAADDERIWQHTLSVARGPGFDAWFEDALAERAAGRRLPLAVRRRADGALVGSTSYLDPSARHKRVEIGSTWYHPDVWATAVNPECKLLLLTHAFEVA